MKKIKLLWLSFYIWLFKPTYSKMSFRCKTCRMNVGVDMLVEHQKTHFYEEKSA